jgi:hypothetical protein
MTDIFLDETGDLAIDANELVLVSAADEVAQRLRCRLRSFLGDWFLNVTQGVPYRDEVFAKRNAPSRVEAAIKKEILTTSGVQELLEYTQVLDGSTRRMTVDFKVRATDGTIVEFSEAIP